MFRHLVRTIRARFPQYLTYPFDVGELYLNILPYRHHRRELALQSNDDYEITLTELLSGARDYLIVGDDMRDALRAELASVNPDPSAFKQFAALQVALSPTALRSLDIGPPDESAVATSAASPTSPTLPGTSIGGRTAATSSAAPAGGPAPVSGSAPLTPMPPAIERTPRTPTPQTIPANPRTSTPGRRSTARQTIPEPGDRCRACNEELPLGKAIVFCPHCGQNLTTVNCPACGSELELTWRFCPACGRPATPP